ncbi:MAG: hypothetical protein EOP54_10485 [Sphingobacteriales bacterium]|nr:MAG: hypothetical protein EOP54_10485 [Sphingobacteriales bacterium]
MRKIIGLFALLLILSVGVYVYWNYMKIYDDGFRDGVVQKFSRKGDVFKTYEGELLGGGFGRVGAGFQAQYFYFSVEDPQVASFIEQNAGKHLTLHFIRYKKNLPWRGENYNAKNQEPGQYIVDKAEISQAQQPAGNEGISNPESQNPIPY